MSFHIRFRKSGLSSGQATEGIMTDGFDWKIPPEDRDDSTPLGRIVGLVLLIASAAAMIMLLATVYNVIDGGW
jgi:hypothetical protein